VLLPVAAPKGGAAPTWGPLQPDRLKSPADLGGAQRWETRRDLVADRVTLEGAKEEGVQLDGTTRLHGRHRYSATVASPRPDLVRMESTTEIRIERPVAATLLVVNTVTTRHQVTVTATITVDGKPFWNRTWSRGLDGRADPGGPS